MGKGSREARKPKKIVEKTNAAAPSTKSPPEGPTKAGGANKK